MGERSGYRVKKIFIFFIYSKIKIFKRMKNLIFTGFLIALIFTLAPDASAQVKIDLKKKIAKEANRRANQKADKGVKKGFDELEKGLKGLVTGEDSTAAGQNRPVSQGAGREGEGAGVAATGYGNNPEALTLNWSKYDFVPGDKIIFEDNLEEEENGEFPSRWDLGSGTAEIARLGGENVIMFRGNATWIVPYLKNPENDYLPDVFTIELDLYKPSGSFNIYLYDRKNQNVRSNATTFDIWSESMECHGAKSNLPGNEKIDNKWVHISIAYTSGKLKGYIDETRLINIPHSEFNPLGLTLYCYHASDNNRVYVKNVRIAEGGVKYYDRFLQDGKIIANGIRFDVGKATLRPESMGVLNEIYQMLSEHPDVSVSVEGHTDSDGDNDLNQKLSEERAETVRKQLISMGISAGRLTSRGFGESMPLDTNDTPEGKAENRRVEFVRK
jgi:outer membrane protein OmpA-like peptidoglycan-associated protein